ncbi:MAG: hypothetical protein M3P30_07220 [Chloroflexota bacterium]|nr:hypothetical protein [Chloroflexota bacterium]
MRRTILLAVAVLLAASACRTGKAGPNADVTATASNDATPRDIPTASEGTTFAPPRHLVFAPGETIASDDFGIFFLDPVTGAAEGWVTAKDQARGGPTARSDGRKLFYYCKLPPPATPGSTQDSANPGVTYVLDTVSKGWSPLTVPGGSYGIIAPDGGTLTQAAISAIGSVVEHTPGAQPRLEQWAPDSSALVIDFAMPNADHPVSLLYLIRMDSSEPIWLTDRLDWAEWSPDGSKFVLTERRLGQRLRTTDAIIVLDARGRKLWSRDAFVFASNPRWSPDSRRLGVQVLHSQPSKEEPNPAYDLSVFDGASGEPVFRVLGAFACAGQYWTADGRLIVGPYGPRSAAKILVHPVARTLSASTHT